MTCTIALAGSAQANTINQLVRFDIIPAYTEEFKTIAIESLNGSLEEAGNIEMKLYADENNPHRIYVYSRWQDQAAYDAHNQEPYTQKLRKLAGKALAAPPEILKLGPTQPGPDHNLREPNPDDETLSIFFIFKIKNGYRDQIIERFETHITESRQDDGCLLFDMYTVDGQDDTFVVYEKWRNKSALFDVHLETPYSEITGSLMEKAMTGTMEEFMNFVTEIPGNKAPLSLEKTWETTGFSQPESVLSIPLHPWLYVSNVNGEDDQGFISRVALDGTIDTLKWVDGINTPTGMGFRAGKIHVADQAQIHVIDVAKGEIIKTIPTTEAKTLNDLSVSEDGRIFISDLTTGSIHTVEGVSVVPWVKSSEFPTPNGVLVDKDFLIVGSVGTVLSRNLTPDQYGSLFKVSLIDQSVQLIKPTEKIGSIDGIVKFHDGYIISNPMAGALFYVTEDSRKIIASDLGSIADIGFDANKEIIYAPFLFENKVIAYKLKGEDISVTDNETFREESMRKFEIPNTTVQLEKGTVWVYDFGAIKLHAYESKDFFGSFVLLLEKDGQAVLVESPPVKENFKELADYITSLGHKSMDLIVSYHPIGAEFIQTDQLEVSNVYSMKHAVDNYVSGPGAPQLVGLKQRFGDAMDVSIYQNVTMLEEGENTIAGIKFIMHNLDFAFDIAIPEINVVHPHMLGHDKHALIFNWDFLDTYTAQLKDYRQKGYEMFFSSHSEPETRGDLTLKIRYLEDLKAIAKSSTGKQAFFDSMNVAYPDFGWPFYLQGTASFLFPDK